MDRPLSSRELDVLVAMIQRAEDSTPSLAVSATSRKRWLDQVPRTRVVGHCSCGTCPSVDLAVVDEHQEAPAATERVVGGRRSGVVLEAFVPDANLLLFIHDDRLSYLELAPMPELSIAEFPAVEAIEFPAAEPG